MEAKTWKDTVMSQEQIWDCVSRVFKRWDDPPMPGDSEYDEFRQEIEREIAKAQAEITWDKAIREAVGWTARELGVDWSQEKNQLKKWEIELP